jgi:hypothetical protein
MTMIVQVIQVESETYWLCRTHGEHINTDMAIRASNLTWYVLPTVHEDMGCRMQNKKKWEGACLSNLHETHIVAETWARREHDSHFGNNWCVARLSKVGVHMSSCTRSARIRPPRHAKCFAPPLRPVAASTT